MVLSAPSGAGKTSLANRAVQEIDDLCFSVSHTTRSPRPGEENGVEYFFVGPAEFEKMIERGEFLEHADVYGKHSYGTTQAFVESQLGKGFDVLLDIDVQGALQVRRRMPQAVLIFVFPPSFEILEQRLRARGLDDEVDIERRLNRAASEIRLFQSYDYMIINDRLEESILELKSIVLAARCQIDRGLERAQRICRTFEEHASEHGQNPRELR